MKRTLFHKNLLTVFIPFSIFLTEPGYAANAAHGKDLHDANCQSCHASMTSGKADQIYTRADRRANSPAALRQQVVRCTKTVGVTWPEDQVDDVVEYLNNTYYKF